MEAADRDFCRGIQYLAAARRLEDWSCDDVTDSKLRKLAAVYRTRANGLLMGVGDDARHAASPHGQTGLGSFRPVR